MYLERIGGALPSAGHASHLRNRGVENSQHRHADCSLCFAVAQVDLYDGDMHVRSVHTVGHPSAVQFMCADELNLPWLPAETVAQLTRNCPSRAVIALACAPPASAAPCSAGRRLTGRTPSSQSQRLARRAAAAAPSTRAIALPCLRRSVPAPKKTSFFPNVAIQVSVIDLRVPDGGCFVQRVLVPGSGPINAITATTGRGVREDPVPPCERYGPAVSCLREEGSWDCTPFCTPCLLAVGPLARQDLGLVAVGGGDRDVHIYDARTWTPLKRWLGATRQARPSAHSTDRLHLKAPRSPGCANSLASERRMPHLSPRR